MPLFETEPIVTVCEETEIDKEKNGGKKNGERRGKEKGRRSLGEGKIGGVLLFFPELLRRYQRKDSVSGGLIRYYRSTLKYPHCTPLRGTSCPLSAPVIAPSGGGDFGQFTRAMQFSDDKIEEH